MILKQQLLRTKVHFRNKFHKKHLPNPNEVLIKKTLAKLLANEKTVISVFPSTNVIYVQTEKKDYTIILGENKIKITNHKLFIETYLNEKFGSILLKMIYKCLDKRKDKMDKIIFNNELDGLNYILKTITKTNK